MKFFGKVGFVELAETSNSKWEELPIERNYYGEVLRNVRRWENGEGVNDNLVISNRISIISDAYMMDNLPSIRYVEWKGTKWKVTSIDIAYPRVILDVGGVYNDQRSV